MSTQRRNARSTDYHAGIKHAVLPSRRVLVGGYGAPRRHCSERSIELGQASCEVDFCTAYLVRTSKVNSARYRRPCLRTSAPACAGSHCIVPQSARLNRHSVAETELRAVHMPARFLALKLPLMGRGSERNRPREYVYCTSPEDLGCLAVAYAMHRVLGRVFRT